MSKTTRKLGRPLYTATFSCEANVKPTQQLIDQFKEMDRVSMIEFSRPYDKLTSKEKIDLHFNINTGVYLSDEEKATKEAEKAKKQKFVKHNKSGRTRSDRPNHANKPKERK